MTSRVQKFLRYRKLGVPSDHAGFLLFIQLLSHQVKSMITCSQFGDMAFQFQVLVYAKRTALVQNS